jgi:ABC-type transporter Mla subunit MlaD
MNEPFRLRYTNQIVGAFLLLSLLFLIVLSLLILRVNDYFVEMDVYWVKASQEQVSDLNKGAAVMILGERAGEVESIRYVEGTDQIRINLNIDPEMSSEIFQDSVVLLERKYGVGAPILVIRRRRPNGGALVPLPPGSQIVNFQGQADRVDQMAKEVESVSQSVRMIQEKLGPTLESIDTAAIRFRGSLETSVDPAFDRTGEAYDSFTETNETLRPDVLKTSEAIRSATKNLETRIETLTEKVEILVDQDMRSTLAEVRESSDDFSDAAKSVNRTSDDVNANVAKTLVDLREAIEQFRTLTDETREVIRIVRQEANDLPGTTASVKDTVSDTQDLVGEIRSHPLLRRYSKQARPTPQVSPSGVRGGSIR